MSTDGNIADIIGAVAGTLTTVSFLPQVMKTWRTRSTGDLSLAMFAAFCTGVALWLVYGVIVVAWPVIFANAATLLLAGFILIMKLRHLLNDEAGTASRDGWRTGKEAAPPRKK